MLGISIESRIQTEMPESEKTILAEAEQKLAAAVELITTKIVNGVDFLHGLISGKTGVKNANRPPAVAVALGQQKNHSQSRIS